MNILNGITNFLAWIDANWVSIIVLIGIILGLWQKISSYLSTSTEEKIEIAKTQIQEWILSLITFAEIDFEDWNSAGSIKRSKVIQEIYDKYPILSKVADQEALISWIDEQIDNALVTLREIIATNKNEEETTTE